MSGRTKICLLTKAKYKRAERYENEVQEIKNITLQSCVSYRKEINSSSGFENRHV